VLTVLYERPRSALVLLRSLGEIEPGHCHVGTGGVRKEVIGECRPSSLQSLLDTDGCAVEVVNQEHPIGGGWDDVSQPGRRSAVLGAHEAGHHVHCGVCKHVHGEPR
jgi:hypothetical protein